jgi:hypothetical protein
MEPKVGERYWLDCGPYEVLSEVAKVTEHGAVFTYPHTLTMGVNVRWHGVSGAVKYSVEQYSGIEKPTDDMTWGGAAHWPQLKPEIYRKTKDSIL